jgi:hypothetical protein
MIGHGGKLPRGDEEGGRRESGSHGGRDARAPLSRAKTEERGRLARIVGLDTSNLSINVLSSATWFQPSSLSDLSQQPKEIAR